MPTPPNPERTLGPPEHPTHQLPRPDRLEILIAEMRAEMRASFERTGSNIDLLGGQIETLAERASVIERRVDALEQRQSDNSIRVKDTSKNDLKQDGAIAELVTKTTAMASQVGTLATELDTVKANQEKAATERESTAAMVKDVRDAVVGFLSNPKLRFVGRVIWAAAMLYAAAKGLKVVP